MATPVHTIEKTSGPVDSGRIDGGHVDSGHVDGGHVDYDFSRIAPEVRRRLRPLGKLDNWHAPVAILADYAVVAAAIWACLQVSWWFYPPALIVIGSTQRALVNLLHESSHKVLARNQLLNLMLGTVFAGYLVFHLYTPYRTSHIGFHHRYLGDPEKDPDYQFHRECGLYDPRVSDRRFFLENILLAVLGLRTASYIRYIVRDRIFYKGPKTNVSMPVGLPTERVVLAFQWLTLASVVIATGTWHLLVLFWLVPLFTTAIAVGWLSELAEHYPMPESERAQLLMTRNRHGWAIENYLLGRHHDNYHLVHHLNMSIPFWNMKRAHHILLDDVTYARWDALWGGVITRRRGRSGSETLVSYATKYRAWRRAGGDPRTASSTFAEVLTLAHASAARNR
ncbi:fatty acid desaturase family protein [Streptomyces sp. MUM 178J]|uniref:fatty acid desaturase family protein n=1 Tax=Streptomyces sp. MUM 178J TaxID=2791991 RepID=UPI001F037C5C|nr:fatty acid desaturase family protein [Streptomyces sp. MUM 178J]WRQ82475.1 fatty acid desaturase family protein [Streptomyces sp. MUM 178J]